MASVTNRRGLTLIRMHDDLAFTLPTMIWKQILIENRYDMGQSAVDAWHIVSFRVGGH